MFVLPRVDLFQISQEEEFSLPEGHVLYRFETTSGAESVYTCLKFAEILLRGGLTHQDLVI
jgi:hypothetical protein